jgi:hypothetical protein
LDAEVPAQPLHVGEQVLGGVVAHVGGGIAGMRRAAPASALVEQDDPVAIRIEVLASARLASPAGAAVHEQGGFAVGVAAGLPVHAVAVTHVEHPVVVRVDRRVQRLGHVLDPLRVDNADRRRSGWALLMRNQGLGIVMSCLASQGRPDGSPSTRRGASRCGGWASAG